MNKQSHEEAIELTFITFLVGLIFWVIDSVAEVLKHKYGLPHIHSETYAEAWSHRLFMQWVFLSFIPVIFVALIIKIFNQDE